MGIDREQSDEGPISQFEAYADGLGYGAFVEGFCGSSEGVGFSAGVLAGVEMPMDVLMGLSTGLLMDAFSELDEDAAQHE